MDRGIFPHGPVDDRDTRLAVRHPGLDADHRTFLTGWPSIIAVILTYVKRSEARDTWLAPHFRRRIRTFGFGLLWISLCVGFIIAPLGSTSLSRGCR